MLVSEYDHQFDEIARLFHSGNFAAASEVAAGIAASSDDPWVIARALGLQVGQLYNTGDTRECPHLLDRAFAVAGELGNHSLLADLYAVAAAIAAEDSFERCVRYLALGSRELDLVEQPIEHTAEAAADLAVAYSYTGFHADAVALAERSYAVVEELGLEVGDYALPEVGVRRAVWMDQRGDTDGCVRLLHDVIDTWKQRVPLADLRSVEFYYYAYCAVRLGALGEPMPFEPVDVPADAVGWEADDLRVLSATCAALAEARPRRAIELLQGHRLNSYTLGPAEGPRLHALAHAATGDYSQAWKVDRRAASLASEGMTPLSRRLLESAKTQLDHETLRHTVERYASEALTDSLTGLPNRRHFERWIADISELQVPVVIGMIDLDEFSAVNNVHGHLGGDLVLQRVATTLARTLRDDDFLARHGGDEFVVVLPRLSLEAAHEIGERLVNAVASEDWHAVVAGTPVSITIGWAALDLSDGLAATLDQADRDMLALKTK